MIAKADVSHVLSIQLGLTVRLYADGEVFGHLSANTLDTIGDRCKADIGVEPIADMPGHFDVWALSADGWAFLFLCIEERRDVRDPCGNPFATD